jgi:hypothetical protein
MGMPSQIDHLKPANNRYQNPYGTEIALFRTSEGGSCDWPFEIPQFLANNFPQFAELRMASQPVFRKTSGG